jgi:hypothetical protein
MKLESVNDVNADASIIEDRPIAGSGRCKACGCKGYRPNYPKNDYCRDCGHSWYMHESVG